MTVSTESLHLKEQKRLPSSLGMSIVLISFTMLFAVLFLAYAVVRFQVNVWPPMGFERINLLLPTISTVILFISSFFVERAKNNLNSRSIVSFRINYFITLILGFLFLITQIKLWSVMDGSGLFVAAGIFPSIIQGFSWIHATHIVLAILFLLVSLPAISHKKKITFKTELLMENATKFWHFLDIIWIVMYVGLFIL